MNRRSFFKIMAGSAIAAVQASSVSALSDVPVLYGNGVVDDTFALQSLVNGDVVEFADPSMAINVGWYGDYFMMPSGVFNISSGIVFNMRDAGDYAIYGNNSVIVKTRKMKAAIIIYEGPNSRGVADNLLLRGKIREALGNGRPV